MLIAITSEGLEPDSLVAEKFGKTPFIIIYNSEKNNFESLRNPYADLFGGAGIQTSQFIIEVNANIVITIDIGINAYRFLKSAGIDVYACSRDRVKEIVQEFIEGKLPIIKEDSFQNFGRQRRGRRRQRKNNF